MDAKERIAEEKEEEEDGVLRLGLPAVVVMVEDGALLEEEDEELMMLLSRPRRVARGSGGVRTSGDVEVLRLLHLPSSLCLSSSTTMTAGGRTAVLRAAIPTWGRTRLNGRGSRVVVVERCAGPFPGWSGCRWRGRGPEGRMQGLKSCCCSKEAREAQVEGRRGEAGQEQWSASAAHGGRPRSMLRFPRQLCGFEAIRAGNPSC